MMELTRGQKVQLQQAGINPGQVFSVQIGINGPAQYDFCCFCLDASGHCQEQNFIFYNNPSNGAVSLRAAQNPSVFDVTLAALPAGCEKLGFTANISVDSNGTMGQINDCTFTVSQNGAVCCSMRLAGSDFASQKSMIALEVYQKGGVWRLAGVANGFAGGLDDLARNYGLDVGEGDSGGGTPPQPAQTYTPPPPSVQSAPQASAPQPSVQPASVQTSSARGSEMQEIRQNGNGEQVYDYAGEEFIWSENDWV
jgi:tellurite resistance protein TerA